MAAISTARDKRQALSAMLERSSVFVMLDARRPGVFVPREHRTNPALVLQIGYGMAVPIRDLKVDEAGVAATLSFGRCPFCCVVPWAAIYALRAEDEPNGTVWEEDIPPDQAALLRPKGLRVVRSEAPMPRRRLARPVLVPPPAPADDGPVLPRSGPRGRPNLRRVK